MPKRVPAKAGKSLQMFFRTVLGLADGILAMIMVIHTFGDYARFHPHLHAIVADGLFRPSGTFHCLPTGYKEPVFVYH